MLYFWPLFDYGEENLVYGECWLLFYMTKLVDCFCSRSMSAVELVGVCCKVSGHTMQCGCANPPVQTAFFKINTSKSWT